MGYIPAGYVQTDSDSEPDLVMDNYPHQKPEKRHYEQVEVSLTEKSTPEDDYDLDIKELLDTDDVVLLQEAVDGGAFDVNHRLNCCYGWSLTLYVASRARSSMLKWLIEKGGKISSDGQEPISGFLALSIVDHNTSDELILQTCELLVQAGDDPEKRQSQLKTPLMLASSYGNTCLVTFLINLKVNLDSTDFQGWTALMHAADAGHGQTARTLVEGGADADIISLDGYTAADLAAIQSHLHLQEVIQKFSKKSKLDWTKSSAHKERNKEMASVLSGLDLAVYQDLFESHNIGLEEFLTISETEMIDMGIKEIGARKRLLEGQRQAHIKSWSKESLPLPNIDGDIETLRLSCPDADNILKNTAEHLRLLKASIAYIRLQFRHHAPSLLKSGSDLVPPSRLFHTLKDCRSRLTGLQRECSLLSTEIYLHDPGLVHQADDGGGHMDQDKPASFTSGCIKVMAVFATVGIAYLVKYVLV